MSWNPLKLIPKILNPVSKILDPVTTVVDLFTPKEALGGSPPASGLWRPITMAVFLVLIVVSFFTGYEIPVEFWYVIGLVMTAYVGGRSWEKTIPKLIEIFVRRAERENETKT